MNPVRKLRLTRLKRALAIAEKRFNLAVANGWADAVETRLHRVGYYQRRIALLERDEGTETGGAN